MEIKEYLQVIKKYRKIFLATWGVIFFLPLFTIFVQSISYEGEKTVFVTRRNESGDMNVSEKYDYFYQLESDKKLAGIIVKSLDDKALLNKIFKDNELNDNENPKKIAISKEEKKWIISRLEGEILESGYIKIKINSHSQDLIKQVSNRLNKQLADKISKIGADKNRLIGLECEPVVITQKGKPYLPIGLGVFFGGLLVAVLLVLGVHYWEEE
jgi:capsular polysaccharide biosynthesis protein